MTKLKFTNVTLPLFPGFYCTHYEAQEELEIEYINEEREKRGLPEAEFDDFDFDYEEYQNEIGKNFCLYVAECLKITGIDCKIEFEKIWSPREYNFRNDEIVCSVEVDFSDVLVKFASLDKEYLSEYLKTNFKSRDGFISFYSHHIDDWLNYRAEDAIKDEIIIGKMLEAIIVCQDNVDYPDEYEYVTQDVYLSAKNSDELVNYPTPEEYVEKCEKWGMTNELIKELSYQEVTKTFTPENLAEQTAYDEFIERMMNMRKGVTC